MPVLIMPLPKAMKGGEHPLEQIRRVEKALEIAYHLRPKNKIRFLSSSGLANHQGVTLADTLERELSRLDLQGVVADEIIKGETTSTHTGENLRLSKETLCDPEWDRVIVVTSPGFLGLPGHTTRIKLLIWQIFHKCGCHRKIEVVGCKPEGSLLYRLSRGITELILIIECLVDPGAKLFDRSSNKRRHQAARP